MGTNNKLRLFRRFARPLAVLGAAVFALLYSLFGGGGAPGVWYGAVFVGAFNGVAVMVLRDFFSPVLTVVGVVVLVVGTFRGDFDSFGFYGLEGWGFTGAVVVAVGILEAAGMINELSDGGE